MGNRYVVDFEMKNVKYQDVKTRIYNWLNQNQFIISDQTDSFIKATRGKTSLPTGMHNFEMNIIQRGEESCLFHGEFYLLVRFKMFGPTSEVAYHPKAIGVNVKKGYYLTEDLITSLRQISAIEVSKEPEKISKEMEAVCPHCGAKIIKDYTFCSKCGKEITKNEKLAYQFCMYCGSKIKAGSKFCIGCGKKL